MSPFFLRLMDTPEDVLPESSRYLTIYFAGVSGLMLYNMGAGILRAVGDSTRPLYILIVCAITNIILDLVFVIVFHLVLPTQQSFPSGYLQFLCCPF